MKILATFPGRNGDLLWALPTIRALSRRIGAPIDLQICGEFAPIVPLLELQPYLGTISADPDWPLVPPAEWNAPHPPEGYDHVFHLGYRGWPQRPLPFETLHTLNEYLTCNLVQHDCGNSFLGADLDLQTPWITAPALFSYQWAWLYGFTDVYFELKYGLVTLLERNRKRFSYGQLPPTNIGANPRWVEEAGENATTWLEAAAMLQRTSLLLTDCSALHVLAVALGTPALLVEPMEARWNPIFYPLGMDGPQVTVVQGTDGKPTFDARHVGDALEAAMALRKDQ